MTTDTAVMVSSEILELQRPLSSMKFVEEPSVQIDDVRCFLDLHFSIDTLAKDKHINFKLQDKV